VIATPFAFEEAGVVERRGPWQILSREQVYDNRWIRVTHHEVVTPTGTPGIYGTVHFKNIGIGILPVDRERHTVLVGQYRFSLGAYSWEIPEGGGPLDVDPLESAARELQEETGLRARRWQKLFDCDLSNSVTDERSIGYLAWDLEQGQSDPDPTEELRVRRLPLEEALRMVDAGEIRDALSVMTLRAAQLLLLQGKFPVP
jgi:8-oxo-dGTP pyrophosphatase MutT (NUDIX family)